MLYNLHVKNLALIDEADVDLTEGLNILTGETGAGKSIILGSVNLALGGRCSADMIRKGASFGLVELTFKITGNRQLRKLEEMGIYPEDGEIILSRRLMDGRSTARINGETVTNSRLKELSEILIDIHGQHEHQSLLYKKNHLHILDEYAKEELKIIKETVKNQYRLFKMKLDEWKHANLDEAERKKEMDFIQYELKEIQDAHLKPGEDEELEEIYRKMLNARKILDNLQQASEIAEGNEQNISTAIGRIIRCMKDAMRYDNSLHDLCREFEEAESLLLDAVRELTVYRGSFEFSEEEYFEVENRLNLLNHLKSRYGKTMNEVMEYERQKEERLTVLSDYDLYLSSLEKELREAEEKLNVSSEKLGGLRRAAGKRLAKEITKGLQDLNFLQVKFEVGFRKLHDYSAEGRDEAEFLISPNPGEPLRPLSEIASGGELSRIMLAIKTVMAEKDEIETLIFDEIDVGISGRTAQKVSEKMAVIGKKHQVICITHLAQIAAMADTHFIIEKKVEKDSTRTEIKKLSEEESVSELARILGGAEITDTVIKNAVEMKDLAKRTK